MRTEKLMHNQLSLLQVRLVTCTVKDNLLDFLRKLGRTVKQSSKHV